MAIPLFTIPIVAVTVVSIITAVSMSHVVLTGMEVSVVWIAGISLIMADVDMTTDAVIISVMEVAGLMTVMVADRTTVMVADRTTVMVAATRVAFPVAATTLVIISVITDADRRTTMDVVHTTAMDADRRTTLDVVRTTAMDAEVLTAVAAVVSSAVAAVAA